MEDVGQITQAATTSAPSWPILRPLDDWRAAFTTLHMWTQVVGKIRLALGAPTNHSWGTTLYVTTSGLTTSPIPDRGRSFAIDFDFVVHRLRVSTSDGAGRWFDLEPMSVAEFYGSTMAALRELDIPVRIFTRPMEVVEAIPFERDHQHASYDAGAAHDYWSALVQAQRVFERFRARFIGKTSPVHFFWGGFDLAVTRFSGRPAPLHPGGIPNCPDRVMQEAYSKELSSAGLWPGAGMGGREQAAFYAYAYPSPAAFRDYPVEPPAAFFHQGLGEFILPYESVRTAPDPDRTLLSFLQSTYEAAAVLARWDRRALEGPPA
jgi:hypothetical protein